MTKRVVIISTVLTGVLAGLAGVYGSPKILLSMVGGDVMALANFFLLGRTVRAMLGADPMGKRRLAALFFFKLLALAAVFVIIWKLPIHVLAFVGGMSAVMVAILVTGLLPSPQQ